MNTDQLTLIQVIKRLCDEPSDKPVKHGWGRGKSYRGYYDQLAFEPVENTTVGAMCEEASKCVGKHMSGYKGGEYWMNEATLCNVASYGECGDDDEITMERLDEMLGIFPAPHWQPIATAPRDGADVLAYVSETDQQFVVYWREKDACWAYALCHQGTICCLPTHWMPLPQPPATN